MLNMIRSNWSKFAGGLLLAGVLGLGGVNAYERLTASCCTPGASCCTPGASCCRGHQVALR
jgi:hypothetical protein